jgi:hypothetical protein
MLAFLTARELCNEGKFVVRFTYVDNLLLMFSCHESTCKHIFRSLFLLLPLKQHVFS